MSEMLNQCTNEKDLDIASGFIMKLLDTLEALGFVDGWDVGSYDGENDGLSESDGLLVG
jgi:hypothetical protein